MLNSDSFIDWMHFGMRRREAGFRSKFYGLALSYLFLVAYTTEIAGGTDSTSTTTICAQVNAKVEVSAASGDLSWEIKPAFPGIYTKTQILHIKANTDWSLIAKDLDTGSSGCMVEWTCSGYGSKRLSKPVKVYIDREVTLPNTNEQPLAYGKSTGSKGVDVRVIFTQEITCEDSPHLYGTIYRKNFAFVGRNN